MLQKLYGNKTIQAKIAWQITFLKCHCHCCCATSIIIYSHCQRLKCRIINWKLVYPSFHLRNKYWKKIFSNNIEYIQRRLQHFEMHSYDICCIFFCKILSCETINNINNSFKMYSEMHFYIFRNNLCLHFYSFCIFHCIWKYDLLRNDGYYNHENKHNNKVNFMLCIKVLLNMDT